MLARPGDDQLTRRCGLVLLNTVLLNNSAAVTGVPRLLAGGNRVPKGRACQYKPVLSPLNERRRLGTYFFPLSLSLSSRLSGRCRDTVVFLASVISSRYPSSTPALDGFTGYVLDATMSSMDSPQLPPQQPRRGGFSSPLPRSLPKQKSAIRRSRSLVSQALQNPRTEEP